jgi:formylglycine-generating enzyme required for sulfatase activity
MKTARALILLPLLSLLALSLWAPVLAQTDTPPPPTATTAPTPTPAPTATLTVEETCAVYGIDSPECRERQVRTGGIWTVVGLGVLIVVLVAIASAYIAGWLELVKNLGKKHAKPVIDPEPPTPPNPVDAATRDYLAAVHRDFAELKFRGIKTRARDIQTPTLSQACVSIRIMAEESRPGGPQKSVAEPGDEAEGFSGQAKTGSSLELAEAMRVTRKLAIIGAAGSGKSTLFQWAGLAAAAAALGHTLSPEQQAIVDALGGARLPLLLPLRDFNQHCGEHKLPRTQHQLLLYLPLFVREKHHLEVPPDFFEHHLRRGCLVMFDGVDEVPGPERQAVREAIDGLVRTYDSECNRFLLSSRTSAYVDESRARDFRTSVVQPLSPDQRERLILGWYEANFPSKEARLQAQALEREISASDPRVRDLAVTPLMATIFAILHFDERVLPCQRAEFYEKAVEVLLTEKYKEGEAARGIRGGWETRRDHLALIAYTLHSQGVENLLEDDLLEVDAVWRRFGADKKPAQAAARDFLDRIARRGGLLEEENGRFGFYTHRTFREFLAGRYLAEELEPDWETLLAPRLHDDQWEEVLRLAAGYLAIGGERRAGRFVRALARLKGDGTAEDRARAQTLAGLALYDIPAERVLPETPGPILADMQALFFANPPTVSERGRRALGLALSGLGDPRFKPAANGLLVPATVPIPGGAFQMGTSPAEAEALKAFEIEPWDDEKPNHPVEVSAFEIGRFPVTNAEYRCFAEGAKGYDNPDWWSPEGRAWREGRDTPDLSIYSKKVQKQVAEWLTRRPVGKRGQPMFWNDSQWNADNLPVVGVSWYEAEAYCKWLSATTGRNYRLPREAEWERAARGPAGTQWPWGPNWDAARCNSEESKLNATTPVGMYPHGASVWAGGAVEDLIGNVWEWCADWYDPKWYSQPEALALDGAGPSTGSARVVRGGSSFFNRRDCRAAYRFRLVPADFHFDLGFRVVRSAWWVRPGVPSGRSSAGGRGPHRAPGPASPDPARTAGPDRARDARHPVPWGSASTPPTAGSSAATASTSCAACGRWPGATGAAKLLWPI